jgi:hypothetical protein
MSYAAKCGGCGTTCPPTKARVFLRPHWYCPSCAYHVEYPDAKVRSIEARVPRERVEEPPLFPTASYERKGGRR